MTVDPYLGTGRETVAVNVSPLHTVYSLARLGLKAPESCIIDGNESLITPRVIGLTMEGLLQGID